MKMRHTGHVSKPRRGWATKVRANECDLSADVLQATDGTVRAISCCTREDAQARQLTDSQLSIQWRCWTRGHTLAEVKGS